MRYGSSNDFSMPNPLAIPETLKATVHIRLRGIRLIKSYLFKCILKHARRGERFDCHNIIASHNMDFYQVIV